MSVIYVEDDTNSILLMRLVFKPTKYQLVVYDNGYKFEQKMPFMFDMDIKAFMFDIDLDGDINGVDLLKMVRTESYFDSIPVIALTASIMLSEQKSLKKKGFTSLISKPINVREFPLLFMRIIQGENIWL